MSSTSSSQSASMELVIDLSAKASSTATFTFFKVPRLAMDQIGDISIDWGDGVLEYIDCTISEAELQRMARDPEFTAVLSISHPLISKETTRIRIFTSSGWLPLRALPKQTVEIESALPTLTTGRTNENGILLASRILPQLVETDLKKRTLLQRIPKDLFAFNPKLEIFDKAFFSSSIREVDASLFSPIQKIRSVRKLFSESALTTVPQGLLKGASFDTICTEAFSQCKNLEHVENPFDSEAIPFVVDGLLAGADHTLFFWADETRRPQMGWIRPAACPQDPAFRIEWQANGKEQPVLAFYPIDLALDGDYIIDWGDGTTQTLDFNEQDLLTHRWKKPGLYTISLHSPAPYPVRPFHCFDGVTRILDPLPRMHPRELRNKNDFAGWAANFRRLTSVSAGLFKNNPEIRNLEQCFAGCLNLEAIDDDILTPLKALSCADSMFAFCYTLERLPQSYASFPRKTELDCFTESNSQNGS